MALREALANAIKHGNRQDVCQARASRDGRGRRQPADHDPGRGEGFEPTQVDDPLAPENRLKTSGRGIFYMKTFMDDVRFRRLDDGGWKSF